MNTPVDCIGIIKAYYAFQLKYVQCCLNDLDTSQLMVLTLTLKTPMKKPLDRHLSTFKASEDLFSALLEYIQIILS
jgi:hypothetical protein